MCEKRVTRKKRRKKSGTTDSNQTENAKNKDGRHVLVITTNSRDAFAAEFSNQRALINRAILRLAGDLRKAGISFVIRPRTLSVCAQAERTPMHLPGLTRVDVLKITPVRYLDSLSYPSFRPICTADTPHAYTESFERDGLRIRLFFSFVD